MYHATCNSWSRYLVSAYSMLRKYRQISHSIQHHHILSIFNFSNKAN